MASAPQETMAAALAAKLTQCSTRITTANADRNIATCFSAWLSLHQSLHHYFALSARAEQSEEVRASQERFDWHWTELPAFPLRRLFPLAAETLSRFPEGSELAMLIADFCVDACKQNVLAKTAAMESGVIQGLCALAARVAAAVRKWDLPREPFLERAALLIYRVFEALHYISETPTVGFYSKAPEVKREFFGAAQKAGPKWTSMQADESNEHYLSIRRNIAEPWEFQFPSNNQAFLKFMGRVFKNLERQSSLLDRQDAMLISELLVILKRTLDPEAVPYNHRLPYFTPALNTSMSVPGDNSGDRDWGQEARLWNDWREATTRKEVRNEALSIRLQQHSGFVRARRNIIWVPATREPGGVASTTLQARSSSDLDRQRTERESSLQEREPEAGPSTNRNARRREQDGFRTAQVTRTARKETMTELRKKEEMPEISRQREKKLRRRLRMQKETVGLVVRRRERGKRIWETQLGVQDRQTRLKTRLRIGGRNRKGRRVRVGGRRIRERKELARECAVGAPGTRKSARPARPSSKSARAASASSTAMQSARSSIGRSTSRHVHEPELKGCSR
ncbi:hypothetical protein KFL_000340290 [Klebsormidium nitens]|uniref:Uncharacterized protein n=1 Tax=Klebsormidium nitens TaxID=105231 RepID=A0A1Y1HSU1_KLENI|nr:hypothetical protein KFL_000340290 [Klebsormidium nitens]|eukprot:GAQ79626.1 hypothetical protein KFL_000340290 [Klebsormidium nitens]